MSSHFHFISTEQLYDVFGTFFDVLRTHPTVAPRVLHVGANFRFIVEDPAAEITVDTNPPGGRAIMGPNELPCEIVLRMKADAGHRFWLGELNLMLALARREITMNGGWKSMV